MHGKTTRSRTRLAALFTLLLAVAGGVQAQGVAWDELTPAQRTLLTDQQAGWDALEPERQQRIALGATRWLEMNRAERREATERFDRWQQLDDTQRAALQVLDRFKTRYGESLDHIYQRSALKNNQAMLLVIGELYERREDAIVGTIINTVPLSARIRSWPEPAPRRMPPVW